MNATIRLEADSVGHAFGRRVLFRDVSFHLEGGAALAITGRNGAGKSTCVQILAGLLTPRRGSVSLVVDGQAVRDPLRAFHCGLVAPYLNVYEGLTARENLAFLAQTRGLPEGSDDLNGALAFVGLAGREDDRVAAFSSGMKQRVKYAAAYLAAPEVLLLDEPTANLDAAGAEIVTQMCAWQRQRGGLLVIATNDPAEAAWGDQVVHLA